MAARPFPRGMAGADREQGNLCSEPIWNSTPGEGTIGDSFVVLESSGMAAGSARC